MSPGGTSCYLPQAIELSYRSDACPCNKGDFQNRSTVVLYSDFVIVSGDSQGRVCFWNGRHGTLVKVSWLSRSRI